MANSRVSCHAYNIPTTITLRDSLGTTIACEKTTPDGSYTLKTSVLPGEPGYSLQIAKPGYLTYTIHINAVDLTYLLSGFNKKNVAINNMEETQKPVLPALPLFSRSTYVNVEYISPDEGISLNEAKKIIASYLGYIGDYSSLSIDEITIEQAWATNRMQIYTRLNSLRQPLAIIVISDSKVVGYIDELNSSDITYLADLNDDGKYELCHNHFGSYYLGRNIRVVDVQNKKQYSGISQYGSDTYVDIDDLHNLMVYRNSGSLLGKLTIENNELAIIDYAYDLDGDTSWYIGNETAESYVIYTADQLRGLTELVNKGLCSFSGKTVTLGADIDLSGYGASFNNGKGWIPIGKYRASSVNFHFSGSFDGGNHKIKGLLINDSSLSTAGLFGYMNGTVKNMEIINGNIIGRTYVGAILGYGNGVVENCCVTGTISGNEYVGGIVGFIGNKIENSYAICSVSGDTAGGVAGSIFGGLVGNCYAAG
ncbi:MAG: hypothetical protein FWG43_03750 [Clostridiales bacterium]|nr:hypothetical protein [Clostridiales bacterium]